MKITYSKDNVTEIELKDGNLLLVSYKTPVALLVSGEGVYKTAKKWSKTTSSHITKFLNRNNLTLAGEKGQDFFDALI